MQHRTRTVTALGGQSRLGGSSHNSGQLQCYFPQAYFIDHSLNTPLKPTKLRKYMARPPGTSFLGAEPTTIPAWIGEYKGKEVSLITDSGADITLISEKTLKNMKNPPPIKTGYSLDLIEVTGETTISGYVTLSIFVETDQGPVELSVEAYVVQDMSTPFLLGNDFADQYCISIIRTEEATYVQFGENGGRVRATNSIGPTQIKEGGHCFSVSKKKPQDNSEPDHAAQKKTKKKRAKERKQALAVRSVKLVTILPQQCVKVPVSANFPTNGTALFVERLFNINKNPDDVYGAPDSLISSSDPFLHVSNFSSKPIKIFPGQTIGIAHNPRNWLDQETENEKISQVHYAHANLIKTLADSMLHPKNYTGPDEPNSDPVEGGPKTAETPPEICSSDKLLEEIHLSPDLNPEQTKALKEVVLENSDAFGLDGRLGHYDETFVEILLKPNSAPISLPPFGASSPEKRRVMDEQMDSWIQLKVIEPSKSPWGAPGFITYRNGKPRMVIDYRKLNELVIPDEFPLPKQDDILQALTGSQWLSTLDALAGFTQLQIKPEDREKTAFRTHRGLYQFKRMPFGFRNGPAVFQRVMQGVLAPFLWIFALVYIDDIVIFSKTFQDHLSHLDQVFKAISKSGITLSPKKCNLGYQSLHLLGQKVSRLGLSTHKEKIDAIISLVEPVNKSELQTFLGMMVYFSAYIPYYAWIVAPLFQLLKKDQIWTWGPLQQKAFGFSKQVLANAPVRAYAIPGLGYRLYTDACDYGIAAILQQIQPIAIKDLRGTRIYDKLKKAFESKEPIPNLITQVSKTDPDVPENGEWAENFESTMVHTERVISYWSRVLKTAEKNYSPTEREALGLKEGLIKFQGFIEGEKVLAITDHAALTWARTYQNVNRRLLTWGTVFAAYPDVKIVHRAGRVHSNVDPISRLRRRIPLQEGPNTDQSTPAPWHSQKEIEGLQNMFEEITPRFEARVLLIAKRTAFQEIRRAEEYPTAKFSVPLKSGTVNYQAAVHCHTITVIAPDDLQEFKAEQEHDDHLGKIIKAFQSDDSASARYPQYFIGDDGMCYFEDALGGSRLCVPASKCRSIMIDVHEGLTESGHGGFAKTYNKIASTYYWPRMSREIKKFVLTCDICQKTKPRRHAPYGLLQPIPIPTRPFEVITIDFIPELPNSNEIDNILVVVDKLTKYGIFIPTTTKITEAETANLLFKHVICDYGLPRQIISDRDSKWTGSFWKEICTIMKIKRSLTTAHHPQADGQTEILNQILEIGLRAYVGPERDDWSELLHPFRLAYNSSINLSTGYSPAFLLRGYEPRTAQNLHQEFSTEIRRKNEFENKNTEDWLEEFTANRKQASDALILAQAFQKKYYNEGRLNIEFQEGDLVLINPHSLELLKSVKGRGKKIFMRYDGPFEIIQKISPLAYRLRMPASYGMHPVINIGHLEKYNRDSQGANDRENRNLNRSDFTELPEFEVESILAERMIKRGRRRNQKQFRVRFKDYGPEFDEWLTKNQLKNAPEILTEWENIRECPE